MKRKRITKKAKELTQGHYFQIFLGLLIIFIINFIFSYLLDKAMPNEELVNLNNLEDMYTEGFKLDVSYTWQFYLKNFISSTLNTFFFGALSISVLRFIRRKRLDFNSKYLAEDIFSAITSYFPKMAVISLIIGLLGTILRLIPYIGDILAIILSIILSFIFLIVEDNRDLSIGDTFVLANERSKGHKMDIFIFQLIYQFLPILVYILIEVIMALVLFYNNDPLSNLGIFGVLTLVVTILFIVIMARLSIIYQSSIAVLYEYEILHDPLNTDFNEDIYDDNILDETIYIADEDVNRSSADEYYHTDSSNFDVIYKDADGNIIDREEV